MYRLARCLILAAGALTVAACGGSSSSDGGGSATAPTETAVITSDNAPTIAGAVVEAVMESGELGDLGGLTLPTGPTSAPVSIGDGEAGQAQTAEVSIGPETVLCAVSGSIIVSGNIDDPNTLSVNDRFSFDFMECDEGDGVRLDGRFEFVIEDIQGDMLSELFALTIGVTVSDLEIFENGEAATLTGNFRLLLDTMDSPSMTIGISGSALTVVSASETVSMANFSTTATIDPVAGTLSLDVNGFLMSSAFDGEVSYATSLSLQLGEGELATGGELVITGADGATITLMVQSNQQVELHIDLDGDGTVDEMQVTTWQELGT